MLAIFAAMMLAAAPQHDTVFTADGGRVIGTVVEDGPHGIAVQLADGSFRRLARRDVLRIEYADGSVARTSEPPPSRPAPAPAYTPPPPPGYPPPGYPPPAYPPPPYYARRPPPYYAEPRPAGPLAPFYLSFGLGGSFLTGDADRVAGQSVRADDVFAPQFNFSLEGAARLTPHLALGLYGDVGTGDPAQLTRNACITQANIDCTDAQLARFGVFLRHTFQPAASSTPWISVGTGFESGKVNSDGVEVFRYSGWEILRLQAGVDLRSSGVVGVGFYGGARVGKFTDFESGGISESIPGGPIHTTFEAGLRFTLFP